MSTVKPSGKLCLASGLVRAVPHDLLKPVDWARHVDRGLIESFFPDLVKGRYHVACKDIEGRDELRTLEEIIIHHQSKDRFWRRLWSFADSLSTVAGRFRLEYDYWYFRRGDPFFVRVYGDVREWSSGERSKLAKTMVEVLKRYHDKDRAEQSKAFAEINELLKEFPADSRFPYVSLKTHHWLTDTLRNNPNFWRRCKENSPFNKVFMVRVSLAESEFHRLKELRNFRGVYSKAIGDALRRLSQWSPMRIGDDLYFICLEEEEVEEVRRLLAESEFGFDVDVYGWTVSRRERQTRADGKSECCYAVDSLELTLLSVGAYENFEYLPEGFAEWARVLDGDYDYVAWVCLVPKGDMRDVAKGFLEWGEKELEKRERKPLPRKICEPTSFLSPELAFSIAEGYHQFLRDCARIVNEENIICMSFHRTLFVCGLSRLSEAYMLFSDIRSIKDKLHLPVLLSVVTAKPKYPFWQISEIIKESYKSGLDECLTFIFGEKMVQLTGKHARLINALEPFIQRERKRQFYRIVNAACKDDKEILKVKIKGLAKERKLQWKTFSKLCWMIDEIARECKDDEELRKQITCEIFKILRMFTR